MTQQITTDKQIIDMITIEKISSICLIAEETGMSEESVIDMITRSLERGHLRGMLTEDGKRFFLGGVKSSAAPVVSAKTDDPVFNYIDVTVLKYAAITGVAMMIAGSVMRGLELGELIPEEFGSTIAAFGLLVIVIGCVYTLTQRT